MVKNQMNRIVEWFNGEWLNKRMNLIFNYLTNNQYSLPLRFNLLSNYQYLLFAEGG